MHEQKTFLFIGASSSVANTAATQLVQAGHRILGVSTKSNPGPYTQLLTVESYRAGKLPVIDDPLDGLVYFPGTITLKPFARLTEADVLRDIEINVLGAAFSLQHYLPNLKSAKHPSVVFISSVAASKGFSFHASISIAKSGLEGLTRALAAELAPHVRVNAIAPGLVNSLMSKGLTSTPEKVAALAARNLIKRIGEPEDIAAMVKFLLGDDSSWITGQIMHIDGGG